MDKKFRDKLQKELEDELNKSNQAIETFLEIAEKLDVKIEKTKDNVHRLKTEQ